MKKRLILIVGLIFMVISANAQKTHDALYLKNGNIIFCKLVEVTGGQYKILMADGSLMVYPAGDVEKFSHEMHLFDGRKKNGFTSSMETGFLIGSPGTRHVAPFSFNFLAGITANTRNIISIGSGVEFIGRSYTPVFVEYKNILYNRKNSPFLFVRGGAVLAIGKNEKTNSYDNYEPRDYKGGGSFTAGAGISWVKEDYATYLSFAYRYAHTSYKQREYNNPNVKYVDNLNRLEIKFGFTF